MLVCVCVCVRIRLSIGMEGRGARLRDLVRRLLPIPDKKKAVLPAPGQGSGGPEKQADLCSV